jgi:hypothetical protein
MMGRKPNDVSVVSVRVTATQRAWCTRGGLSAGAYLRDLLRDDMTDPEQPPAPRVVVAMGTAPATAVAEIRSDVPVRVVRPVVREDVQSRFKQGKLKESAALAAIEAVGSRADRKAAREARQIAERIGPPQRGVDWLALQRVAVPSADVDAVDAGQEEA